MSTEVFITACGPSLANTELSLLEGRDIIAINNSFQKLPNAKYVYFTDADWFQRWRGELLMHRGKKIRGSLPGEELMVSWVEEWTFTSERGLSLEPYSLAHGFNSGAAAINLAVQLDYNWIGLIGYDMRNVDGRQNFHGDAVRKTPDEAYQNQFIPSFEAMAQSLLDMDVEVINLTPNSALKAFPSLHAAAHVRAIGDSASVETRAIAIDQLSQYR